ncbi:hypothetical protein AVEN_171564-1 [Araneus ventricosus]|uniref:Uncharacterized protein n=1 Tax=Araneus ventricosus TaxID=182803 RepID=A0A4Y2K1E3_ARAVE|nr:hypothetical protein AVEN_171564-1 [Araneus ventricosus]
MVVRYSALLKEGWFNYQVEVGNKIRHKHIDQMRSIESDIPLSSPELDLSFPSIPEVSSISPSDTELPLVFPAPTGEVEPRQVELKPSNTMTPEQRSESSTVNPNTVGSVPTAFALCRRTRVRKAPDRLKLGLFKFVSN